MQNLQRLTDCLNNVARQDVNQREALEAHRNLCGFMSLLIKINEREQVVPTKSEGAENENQ